MKNKLHINALFSVTFLTAAMLLTACGENSKFVSNPVQKRLTNLGEVYTDNNGMTLYTFNKDTPNTSNCNDGCAIKWPPLMASDEASATGNFSIISRADNSKQWALNGRPLYRWVNDNAPGDTTGEGIKSVWFVAQTAPISKRSTTVTTEGTENTATVLTDTAGKTLYIYTPDKANQGGSSCNNGCAIEWPPLLATDQDQANGDYNIITRNDNSKQWAYHGMPLYRFVDDSVAGDAIGEDDENIWYVAQAIPTSKQHTAQGVVLSDTQGLSLYILDNEDTSNLLCKGPCLTAWPPLQADANAIARDDYSIFTNGNGDAQWAYKNKPLYRWKNDSNPGDITGHGLAHPSNASWLVAKP